MTKQSYKSWFHFSFPAIRWNLLYVSLLSYCSNILTVQGYQHASWLFMLSLNALAIALSLSFHLNVHPIMQKFFSRTLVRHSCKSNFSFLISSFYLTGIFDSAKDLCCTRACQHCWCMHCNQNQINFLWQHRQLQCNWISCKSSF